MLGQQWLQEGTGNKNSRVDLGLWFLNIKSTQNKRKNILDFIKIKFDGILCPSKDTIKEVKRQHKNGRKYFQIINLISDFYQEYYIRNTYTSIIKRYPKWKWTNDWNRYFSKNDIKCPRTHVKTCSTSLKKCKSKPWWDTLHTHKDGHSRHW